MSDAKMEMPELVRVSWKDIFGKEPLSIYRKVLIRCPTLGRWFTEVVISAEKLGFDRALDLLYELLCEMDKNREKGIREEFYSFDGVHFVRLHFFLTKNSDGKECKIWVTEVVCPINKETQESVQAFNSGSELNEEDMKHLFIGLIQRFPDQVNVMDPEATKDDFDGPMGYFFFMDSDEYEDVVAEFHRRVNDEIARRMKEEKEREAATK